MLKAEYVMIYKAKKKHVLKHQLHPLTESKMMRKSQS